MLDLIPAGAVALDAAELDEINGGSFWRKIGAAVAIGFATGRWLACAFECLFRDA